MKLLLESLEDLILLEQMTEESGEDDSLDGFGSKYAPGEELGCGEKEIEHDRHRWELDPASSEDYIERLHPRGVSSRWRHFSG
ncbi:MAG TPA: DUF6335 family protein [Thermoanaerobaculia bacterium]|nr:DUF6335 family protein [Thermoanaerobaculia bacterium]